jgi:nucleotide-binding universal stress UspA family protein
MKTIVVGYDGSDAAERALGRAADIAQAFSARLFVVRVSGLAPVPAPVSAFEPAAARPFHRRWPARSRQAERCRCPNR